MNNPSLQINIIPLGECLRDTSYSIKKSLIAQASIIREIKYAIHDLEVMALKPGLVELGVPGTSV